MGKDDVEPVIAEGRSARKSLIGHDQLLDPKARRLHQTSSKKPKFPIIIDLIEDGVRSRSLAAASILLIMTLAAHVALNGVITDPKPLWGDDEVSTVEWVLEPPRFVQIDKQFPIYPTVAVKNFVGFGLKDVNVTASISSFIPNDQTVCNVIGGSVEGMRGKLACGATDITVKSAVTDSRGFAVFEGMAVNSLLAGLAVIEVTVEGRTVSSEINVETPITAVTLDSGVSLSVQHAAGETLQPITVVARDIMLNAVQNRSCFPFVRGVSADDLVRDSATGSPLMSYVPNVDDGKYTLMDNEGVVITDSNGMATFDNLVIRGSTNAYSYLQIACEGVFAAALIQLQLTTTVNAVAIVEEKTTTVVEGRKMSQPPQVKVTNAGGAAVSGVYCFAKVSLFNGLTAVERLVSNVLTEETVIEKDLIDVVSAPTDEQGVAVFSDLAFSVEGKTGKFNLKYICDGVESASGADIAVKSSTAFVETNWSPPAKVVVPKKFKDLPSLLVLNNAGQPVAGKRLEKVTLKGKSSSKILPATHYASLPSNGNGEVVLTEFKVDAGDASEEVKFSFTVDGIESKDTAGVLLVPFFQFDSNAQAVEEEGEAASDAAVDTSTDASADATDGGRRRRLTGAERKRVMHKRAHVLGDVIEAKRRRALVSEYRHQLQDLDGTTDLDGITDLDDIIDLFDLTSDVDDVTILTADVDDISSGDVFSVESTDFEDGDSFEDFDEFYFFDPFADPFDDLEAFEETDDLAGFYEGDIVWVTCPDGVYNPWEEVYLDEFDLDFRRMLARRAPEAERSQNDRRLVEDYEQVKVNRRRRLNRTIRRRNLRMKEEADVYNFSLDDLARALQDLDGTDVDGTDVDGFTTTDVDGLSSDIDGLTSDVDGFTDTVSDFDSISSDLDGAITDFDSFINDLDGATFDIDDLTGSDFSFDIDDFSGSSSFSFDIDDLSDFSFDVDDIFTSDDLFVGDDDGATSFFDTLDEDEEVIEAPDDWIEGTCPSSMVDLYEEPFDYDDLLDFEFDEDDDAFFDDFFADDGFDDAIAVDVESLNFPPDDPEQLNALKTYCASFNPTDVAETDLENLYTNGNAAIYGDAEDACTACGATWECSWCMDDGAVGCVVADNYDQCYDFLDTRWEEFPYYCDPEVVLEEAAEYEAFLEDLAATEAEFNQPEKQVALQEQYTQDCALDENGHYVGGERVEEWGFCEAFLSGEYVFPDGSGAQLCSSLSVQQWKGTELTVGTASTAEEGVVLLASDTRSDPVEGVNVCAFIKDGEEAYPQSSSLGCATTDAEGKATITGITVSSAVRDNRASNFYFVGTLDDKTCVTPEFPRLIKQAAQEITVEQEMPTTDSQPGEPVPFKVKVVNAEGAGVEGVPVRASIVFVPTYITDMLGDGTDLQAQIMENYQVNSDADGIADFSNFLVKEGWYGDFGVQVDAYGFLGKNPTLFAFTIANPVASIEQIEAASGADGVVKIGVPFSNQPSVKVLGTGGQNLANFRVTAALVDANGSPSTKDLINFVSEPSGADGVATWDSLAFTSAGVAKYSFTFFTGDLAADTDPATTTGTGATSNVDSSTADSSTGGRMLMSDDMASIGPQEWDSHPRRMEQKRRLAERVPHGRHLSVVGVSEAQNVAKAVRFVQSADLTVLTRTKLEVIVEPHKAASLGTALKQPIVVKVLNDDGEPVAGTTVTAVIAEAPADSDVEIRASTKTAVTSDLGLATFIGMIFDGSTEGEYSLKFTVEGGETPKTNAFQLTTTVAALTILEQATLSVDLKEAFRLTVKAVDQSDNPVRRAPIRMIFVDNPGNAAMLASRTIATTSDSGIAAFDVVFTQGVSGDYKLQAVFQNVSSNTSPIIRMSNDVAQVVVETHISARSGNSIKIQQERVDSILTVTQPRIRVLDKNGFGLKGKSVKLKATPESNSLAPRFNPLVTTDANGYYQFADLYFTDGLSGEYEIWFRVDGVDSVKTTVTIKNMIRPDLSNLDNFKTAAYIFVLTMIPVFYSNSMWEPMWGLPVGIVVGVAYTIYFIVLMVGEYQENGKLDPYDTTLKSLVVFNFAFLLFAAGMALFNFIKRDKRPETYFHEKMIAGEEVVKALFQKWQPPPPFLVEEKPPEGAKFMEKIKWKLAKRKRDKKRAKEPWELPYNGLVKNYFRYSVRYTTTMWVSAFFGVLGLISCSACVVWAKYNLRNEFQSIVDGQATFYRESQIYAKSVEALVLTLGEFSIPGQGATHGLQEVILDEVYPFLDAVEISGAIATVVSVLVCFFGWKKMATNYKNTVLGVRSGKIKFDRNQFPIKFVGQHLGLQAGATILTILAVFTILWLALFLFAFGPIRDKIISTVIGVVISIFSVTLLQTLAIVFFSMYVIQAKIHIRNRRQFALFDLFVTVTSLVAGPMKSLVRWIVGIVLWNVAFLRNDVAIALVGNKDPGYRAWAAAMLMDADFNNPVKIAASSAFSIYLEERDGEAYTEEKKKSNLNRNRWQLAYMMVRNPKLQQYRVKIERKVVSKTGEVLEELPASPAPTKK